MFTGFNYKVYQDAFKDIEKEITLFENEMRTIAWLEKKSVPPNSTIVIDDIYGFGIDRGYYGKYMFYWFSSF